MSPNHQSQLQTRFLIHFHYKTIGANCKLHLNHIMTTFLPHLHVTKPLEPITNQIFSTFYYIFTTFTCHQTIGANYKLDFSYIFTTKLLLPVLYYVYTTFSLHFHHIYMSPNHWSQLQTRFFQHFHYKTIRANCTLHLNHIFTTFSPHLHVTKPLEPITNQIFATFSLQNYWSNCKLLLHHIFTTLSPHLHVTKPLEPITNQIIATFSPHFHYKTIEAICIRHLYHIFSTF